MHGEATQSPGVERTGTDLERQKPRPLLQHVRVAVALGGVVGPVAGGFLADHFSYSAAFLAAVIVGVVPIALSFTVPVIKQSPRQASPASGSSTLKLLQNPALRLALASSALALYSRDIFVAYFPLLGSQLGMSASEIGWMITIQGFTMVVVRFYLTRFTDRFGRSHTLLGSIVIAGLAFLLIPLTGRFYLLAVLSALMGAGLGFSQPLSMTIAYNVSPRTRTGEVLGLRLASNRLSQMIAPLFFGLLGSSAGLVYVFYVSGAFLIGGAFLTRAKSADQPAA